MVQMRSLLQGFQISIFIYDYAAVDKISTDIKLSSRPFVIAKLTYYLCICANITMVEYSSL